VTIVRHAGQLPAILCPTNPEQYAAFNQQQITARTSRSSPVKPVTPVILVPLSDSPTIPSLSLLLQQGTTPTAVCFQQDLLERAKRSEEEWLPSALAQIRHLIQMKEDCLANAAHQSAGETASSPIDPPIILAYSANPAVSPSTISACVNAGASGVLKPPYDLETARLVRRMVRAAKEGRISSVVGLHNLLTSRSSPPSQENDSAQKVVLPPTALSMGGEHEGERVLNGAFRPQHRRGNSVNLDQSQYSSLSSGSRKLSLPPAPPTLLPFTIQKKPSTLSTAHSPAIAEHRNSIDVQLESLLVYQPLVEQRRRSVDVSGLEIALKRAQRAFELVTPKLNGKTWDDAIDKLDDAKDHESEHDDDALRDTQLAELLSAMYYQTQQTIQIQMDDYAK
jgi:hypothetical protein